MAETASRGVAPPGEVTRGFFARGRARGKGEVAAEDGRSEDGGRLRATAPSGSVSARDVADAARRSYELAEGGGVAAGGLSLPRR